VAHACNPSYSGGRNQEEHGSKLDLANSSVRPYLKITFHKNGQAEWLKVLTLSSNPSIEKKNSHIIGYIIQSI
jgi:hypothetical protein